MDREYPVKLKWLEEENPGETDKVFSLAFEGLNHPTLALIYESKEDAAFRARLFQYESQEGTDFFNDQGEQEEFKSLDEAVAWVESKLGLS